jgi:trans-aconitate methyltransferase
MEHPDPGWDAEPGPDDDDDEADPEGLARWSGATGVHWAAEADRYDRINQRFAEQLLAAVEPHRGERFVDIGCGTGAVTIALARAVGPGGSAVGLDLSRQMLEVARDRVAAAGLDNVELWHGDAQSSDLSAAGAHALVSRFGLMFFADPPVAFANLGTALRPGGQLAFTCWQDMASNDWIMVPAVAAVVYIPVPEGLAGTGVQGAFALADPARTTALLEQAGFVDVTIEPLAERMWMGDSVDDTVAFMRTTEFATTLFSGAPPARADAAWSAIARALADHAGPDGVELQGKAWLVTATRP